MSSLEEASHFAKSRGRTLGRGTVTIDDCIPGVIVFIKKCQYILHRDFVESGLSILGLRHPALVIKRVESKASHVLICPLTTFGGRTVQERYPHNRMQRNNYLPIHPRSPITPRGVQLHTAGEPLKKPGYVSIAATYVVHSNMLRAYDWDFAVGDYRLTEASLGQVLQELGRRQNIPGPRLISQGTHLPLPYGLPLNSPIANLGTIPGDITFEPSSGSPAVQRTSLHTVPNTHETETLFVPTSNHDLQRRLPPPAVYQLPRKLGPSFAVLVILFIIVCLVLGFLLSS
ncbi:hypothetical protein MMC27_006708 [Xylographa pallens]|nr:hypothetical protein [Xylographa pallens]